MIRKNILSLLTPILVFALPGGEEIQRGDVHFERGKDQLKIFASDSSIINYQNFNVAQHETIDFIQPNSSARVLNRIHEAAPSQINGRIQANGHVYLVNPSGIIFGPNSVIDVGKFFAVAGRIRDEDFLKKRDIFFDSQGKIINYGQLQGDEVHLIGAAVDNQGWIQAKEGAVTLASGNSTSIEGIGAMDLISYTISHSGKITAKKVQIEGDRVYSSGEIESNGEKGGTVQILGDSIRLEGACINASGQNGGGTVLIGGDYQGQDNLRQSKKTMIDSQSFIDVSAIEAGDGGTAIIWSKGVTYFDGEILAQGGIKGGNGGFVETSGKYSLGSERGRVNTRARSNIGKMGFWVLDPLSITIASSGSSSLTQASSCSDTTTNLTISNTTINGALSNVLLCASSSITQNSDAPIDIAAPGIGITYQAGSGSSVTLNSNVTTNNGDIISTSAPTTIGGITTINSGTGNISLGALTIPTGSNVTLQIGATPGALTISDTTTLSGSLNLVSSGGSIITGDIYGPNSNLTINGGSSASVSLGNLILSNFTLTNSGSTTVRGITTAAAINLTNSTSRINFLGNVLMATSDPPDSPTSNSSRNTRVSGIIDWVFRSNFWDTVPLTRYLSRKQILSMRIHQNLNSKSDLLKIWLGIEQKEVNPIESALSTYQAKRNLQGAIVNLFEFEMDLKRWNVKEALNYLSRIQTLISSIQKKIWRKISSDLFTGMGITKSTGEVEFEPEQSFINDILEYTKPDSFSLAEWRKFVLRPKQGSDY